MKEVGNTVNKMDLEDSIKITILSMKVNSKMVIHITKAKHNQYKESATKTILFTID